MSKRFDELVAGQIFMRALRPSSPSSPSSGRIYMKVSGGEPFVVIGRHSRTVYEHAAVALDGGMLAVFEGDEPCDLVLERIRWPL